MERIFRIKEVNSDTSFQDKTLIVDKKKINLLIVLELGGMSQFNRTYNDIWKCVKLDSIADIEAINKLNAEYEYKNICLVHHANIFSDTSKGKNSWAILFANKIREIKQVLSRLETPTEIDNTYVTKVVEKAQSMYTENAPNEQKIKTCLGLKLLISNLLDEGTFISVACKEAGDPDFLIELGDFTDKNIKIFGNTNFSFIENNDSVIEQGLKCAAFRCILNSFVSSAWQNKKGWIYYDTKNKKTVVTNKDLWIYSLGTKIYELVARSKELTEDQSKKEEHAQRYFSKTYEAFYIKNWGKPAFNNWKSVIKKIYIDFK
ncbi:hypothetical protein [Flavobacterium ginsengiterrae]|uniref:Uncharacterized protein n=1 Tax=Flavobacterium ginsengiterrae TaxID=871695 RepID=A0ABP7GR30_9FLAO